MHIYIVFNVCFMLHYKCVIEVDSKQIIVFYKGKSFYGYIVSEIIISEIQQKYSLCKFLFMLKCSNAHPLLILVL